MKTNKHLGSSFDEYLDEEGARAEAEAIAAKRVISYQIEQEMKKKRMTKYKMAQKMRTSRSSLDRILDPNNISITLQTLERAATVLGKRVKLQLT